MNTVLRQVARELKYRPLPDLIGRQVIVTSAGSAAAEVFAQLSDGLPEDTGSFEGDSKQCKLTVAKYGNLDLTFPFHGFAWDSGDSLGIPLLEEFGFVVRDRSPNGDPYSGNEKDPTCLEFLRDDIAKLQNVLKLFF